MKKSDRREFAKVMAGMASAFQKEVSKETTDIYFRLLEDLPIEKIQEAAVHVSKTKKISTLPTIGEIREFIVKGLEGFALEAWHIANKAIIDVGIYRSVCFEDKVIHSVIDNEFGGWTNFCNADPKDDTWDRKRFLDAYFLYSGMKEHPESLPGINESENLLRGFGYDKGETVLIGQGEEVKKLKGGERK